MNLTLSALPGANAIAPTRSPENGVSALNEPDPCHRIVARVRPQAAPGMNLAASRTAPGCAALTRATLAKALAWHTSAYSPRSGRQVLFKLALPIGPGRSATSGLGHSKSGQSALPQSRL